MASDRLLFAAPPISFLARPNASRRCLDVRESKPRLTPDGTSCAWRNFPYVLHRSYRVCADRLADNGGRIR